MLTDSALKKLFRKPNEKQLVLTDRDGLYCRVSKTGSISFFMRYQYNGKADALTLGKYPSLSLAEARRQNIELRSALNDGVNPKIKKKIEVSENQTALTLNDLCDMWYEKEAVPTIKNHKMIMAQMKNHLLPQLGTIPAKEITTIMFFEAFENVHKKAPSVIPSLLLYTRNCYALAVRRRILENNPLIGITPKRDFHVEQNTVDRYLNDDELKLVLTYLDKSHERYYLKNTIIFLALFYGCRMSELRLAEQKHFDFEKMIWTVPPENHKTGKKTKRPLVRPIIPEIKERIEFLMALSSNPKYLITARGSVEPPIASNWVKWVGQINLWLRKNGYEEIEHWSMHDFRRTLRTNMSKFAEPHICEIMLGHTLPGMWRVYDKGYYIDEQREGYSKWYNKLTNLINDNHNVVSIDKYA
ncbi:tyrosine-type recombinase/integrase [Vibrio harveyi]|uniref:tyrosine-type recombinase/integrase n=1 Tax=Vibrio harveyi TaxID=669 RepID=UPI001EEEE063|nr:site-specific integrase [Vibrio harveyi]